MRVLRRPALTTNWILCALLLQGMENRCKLAPMAFTVPVGDANAALAGRTFTATSKDCCYSEMVFDTA